MTTRLFPSLHELSDLVWLQTGFLGDIVLTTGAIALAAELRPGIRQHLITTKIGAEALKDLPQLTSCTVFEKDAGALKSFLRVRGDLREKIKLTKLKSQKRVVLLQPHRSFRSSFLARFLNLPTITYRETNFAWLATARVDRVAVLHETQRIALLLAPLGVSRERIAFARPILTPASLDPLVLWQEEIGQFPGRLVGIAPGSVWGTKRWPRHGFIETAHRLLIQHAVGIVLIGSQAEREICDSIEAALRKIAAKQKSGLQVKGAAPIWNLAGKTSLKDLRALFPRLTLLISNDSSPVHFASAFSIPTVGIFGATVPEMGFAPLAPGSISVGQDLPCRPCSDHGPKVCPLSHFKCMRELAAEKVYDACRKIIGEPLLPEHAAQ